MIAVDTNILVAAHRRDHEWHEQANEKIREIAEGIKSWLLPFHCLVEFYAIATHPKIFMPPSTPAQACEQIRCWCDSPSVIVCYSSISSQQIFIELLTSTLAKGGAAHDIRIVADALAVGATTLWTKDRNLTQITELAVVDPLRN